MKDFLAGLILAVIVVVVASVFSPEPETVKEPKVEPAPVCIHKVHLGTAYRCGKWTSESGPSQYSACELWVPEPYTKCAEWSKP